MKPGERFESLVALMARLRAPDGCPWDREQTLESLRPFILEEAYELVEAIDTSDPASIREELGDLLLEVLFVSQICSEHSHFTVGDVMTSLEDKLIRRHPHVFGDRSAGSPQEALASWEDMKSAEKTPSTSVLADVPLALPALVRAHKLSARAAREGFDWDSADEVLDKLAEEIRELEKARSSTESADIAEEVGDLLFAVVNLARHLGVDAELALQAANRKFVDRFRHIETELEGRSRSLADASMTEMEALWQDAKKQPAQRRSRPPKSVDPDHEEH